MSPSPDRPSSRTDTDPLARRGTVGRRVPVGQLVRTMVLGAGLFLVGWLIVRTWLVEGLVVPWEVASGSMAPTLRGPHWHGRCPECGHPFTIGADRGEIGPKVPCLACGARLPIDPSRPIAGDRVLLDRLTYTLRPPRRWELVAFREPDHPTRIAVKRVVGLPGETVQIRHGDIYIDGRIVRKSLVEQKEMAVRLDPDETPLAWAPRHTETGRSVENQDWLDLFFPKGPPTSRLPYNRTIPIRAEAIHPVDDLMISFRIRRRKGHFEKNGPFRLAACRENSRFEVRWDFATGRIELRRPTDDGMKLVEEAVIRPLGDENQENGPTVDCSWFDRQFLFAVDGKRLFQVPLPAERPENGANSPSEGFRRSKKPRFSLAPGGGALEISDLAVRRDIYYTAPVGVENRAGSRRPVRLGEDVYFVLGDNSPVSRDSRSWPLDKGVHQGDLLGKPRPVSRPSPDPAEP